MLFGVIMMRCALHISMCKWPVMLDTSTKLVWNTDDVKLSDLGASVNIDDAMMLPITRLDRVGKSTEQYRLSAGMMHEDVLLSVVGILATVSVVITDCCQMMRHVPRVVDLCQCSSVCHCVCSWSSTLLHGADLT